MSSLLNTGMALVVFLFLGLSVYGQAEKQKTVREIISADTTVGNFGIVVLENWGGRQEITSLGYACKGRVANDSTIFNIASCTKTYIATLILLLREEGKINIDSPVNAYIRINELPFSDSVTIRNLLNHTSGIPDFSPSADYIEAMTDSLRLYDRTDIFGFLRKQEPNRPGLKFKYNNIGYTVLGLIAEMVTQQPMETLLERYIFNELNLKKTFFHYPLSQANTACPGYELLLTEHPRKINYLNMDNLSFAAGNIYTTAKELDLFLRKLFIEKSILSEASLSEMVSPFKISQKSENGIGLGVFVTEANGSAMFTHTGRYLMGYSSAYACFPDSKYSVIILRNNIILDYEKRSNLSNKIIAHLINHRLNLKP